MSRPGEWFRRLSYLLNRRHHQDALRAEMEAHRAALGDAKHFGNARRLREESDEAWGWTWLDNGARDVRLAARLLTRSPGYSATVILSLALSLVLTTVTLAIVNAYLLRPLPYPEADRLYHVRYAPPGPWEPGGMSSLDWPSVTDVVEFPITSAGDTLYLSDGAYAQAARTQRVSPSFIAGLGVSATLGRALDPRDWSAGSDAVAMIGDDLWRTRYAGDPSIIGRVIRSETESGQGRVETFRIVGVLPPGFYVGRDSSFGVDLLLPLTGRTRTYLVRLRAGVDVATAERRLTAAAREVATDLPADWAGVTLDSMRERYVGDLRPILLGLGAGAVMILLLVCTNIAVLTLLRGQRREKELAIRVALGAGRWRLARMMAVEAAMLAAAALALGLVVGHLTLSLLGTSIEVRLGRPSPGGAAALGVDGTVLGLVGGLAFAVAVFLSLLPMLGGWGRHLGDVLRRDRTSTTDGRTARRLRSALLVCEVAGTLVVLVGGGLLLRSTLSMLDTDLGFEPEVVSRSRLALRSADYADTTDLFRMQQAFAAAVAQRVGSPVVYASWPPFADFPVVLAETPETTGSGVSAGWVRVGGSYFSTIGARIRQGRDLTADDERDNAPVAVVSESLARRLWPDGSALGRQIRSVETTPGGLTAGPWRTVVGVAADVRQHYFDREQHDLYAPFGPSDRGRFASFYVRSSLPPSDLWPILRTTAAQLDPHAIVTEPRRAASENVQLVGMRFLTRTIGVVAAMTIFLAILGIYGVTAFAARQRAREIAVRIALGATANSVRRLFMRDIVLILSTGVSVGIAAALLLSQLVESWLYGVPPRDATTIAGASLLLVAVGTLAAVGPVWRASVASPIVVLKDG